MNEKRIGLVKDILINLKGTYEELRKITQEIESSSAEYYANLGNENKNRMNEEIEKLKSNIENMKLQNNQVTELINEWYHFTNDESEINKIYFPLKFYLKRERTKKDINKKNQYLYKLSVENRLIKENITNIKRGLELKAIEEIKKNGMYMKYENLLRKKSEYIRDLQFVLPTLKELFTQRDINLSEIDSLLEKINN